MNAHVNPPKAFTLTPKQVEGNRLLSSGARHIAMVGGARSGKTFLLTRATVIRALKASSSRHAILRLRSNAARSSIALDTLPRVMKICAPGIELVEHRMDGFFELPNKAQIWVGGLDDKDRVEKILGQEFVTIYLNECSQIPYGSVLVARTRLAQVVEGLEQRMYYDLNPLGKLHWSNTEFGEKRDPVSKQPLKNPGSFIRFFLNPEDNKANLSEDYLDSLRNLPERQFRRFYKGEYVSEVDNALWTYERIEACREEKHDYELCPMQKIVVSVDPSGMRGEEDTRSDAIGIVVAGKGRDGRMYVLEDLTCRLGPAGWAAVAVGAYHKWNADAILGEFNYGGAMVEHTIRSVDATVKYREVKASRAKWIRAEPVGALYEEKVDKVRHVGRFPDLEDQMCMFTTAGYSGDKSPNNADAMIWAATDLMLESGAFDLNRFLKAYS